MFAFEEIEQHLQALICMVCRAYAMGAHAHTMVPIVVQAVNVQMHMIWAPQLCGVEIPQDGYLGL